MNRDAADGSTGIKIPGNAATLQNVSRVKLHRDMETIFLRNLPYIFFHIFSQ